MSLSQFSQYHTTYAQRWCIGMALEPCGHPWIAGKRRQHQSRRCRISNVAWWSWWSWCNWTTKPHVLPHETTWNHWQILGKSWIIRGLSGEMNMVILSRIVKPKMFEPQKYRRKGSQSYFIHDKKKKATNIFSSTCVGSPGKKKTCIFTESILKSLSSRIFGMFGLENFWPIALFTTSEVICHSPLELGTPGYSFKIWLDWIELACGLWVSLWCLTSPFQILQTAGQSMSIFIIFMAGFLQFRLRRHRLTKHYLQPGHCGLGSLLGQAETQWLGVDAGMTRGCFADVLAIADPKTFQNQWHVGDRGGTWRYPVPRRYHLDQGSKT